MAAKIMEPAIGASTWALGSHKCTPYKGILIRKAIMHASQRMLLDHEEFRGVLLRDRIRKFRVPVEFWMLIKAIRRGIEPINV